MGVFDPDYFNLGEGFQVKLIALCLRDPGFLQSHLDVLKPHYFENGHLSVLESLVLDYFSKHYIVPSHEAIVATVHEYARQYGGDKSSELLGLLGSWLDHVYTVDLSDSAFITEKVVEFGQRQAIKVAIGEGLDMLEKRDKDLGKLRQIFDDALRVGSSRDMGTDFGKVALNLPQMMMNDPVYGIKNKVPTGFYALDKNLMGGIGAGEVMVVAGPPGRGKSTVMVNIGKRAAQHFRSVNSNKSVIYVTLEGGMKELDIAAKFGACLTGVQINDIASGNPVYQSKVVDVLQGLGPNSIRIKYFSPGSVGAEDLRWFFANLMSMESIDPGLIIIDYADKLKGMEDSRYLEAGRIYDQFTGIGDKFKCPIITGSQINREWSGEETIDMRGLAESWLKGANADVIVTLNQTKEEHAAQVMRLFLAKVRKGADHGIIYCHWVTANALCWELSQQEVNDLKSKK